MARFTRPAGAALAAAGAAWLLLDLVRKPSWRANLAWLARSCRRPAGREARWEQAIGDAIDPWDRAFGRRGAARRGGSRTATRPASSLGR